MTSLLTITNTYLSLRDELDTTDVEQDTTDLVALFDQAYGTFLAKAENVAAIIREYEMRAVAIEDELDRLKQRHESAQRKAAWLRDYLLNKLQAIEQTHVVTPRFTLSVQTTKAVEITNENDIPGQFVTIETKTKISKTAIRNAIEKDGEVVPGAQLVEHVHLRLT